VRAAECLEPPALRLGLDTLGDQRQAKGPAEPDDRLGERGAPRVVSDVVDECLVDLENVERQVRSIASDE